MIKLDLTDSSDYLNFKKTKMQYWNPIHDHDLPEFINLNINLSDNIDSCGGWTNINNPVLSFSSLVTLLLSQLHHCHHHYIILNL